MPRQRTCDCNECERCKNRIRSAERYQSMTMEERRALVVRRNPEKVRAADAARYTRDKPKRLALATKWQQQNREKRRTISNEWSARNAEKRRAHLRVKRAVAKGLLVRLPCIECGADAQAHHEDYAKPLDVIWLCSTHHAAHHVAMRRAAAIHQEQDR